MARIRAILTPATLTLPVLAVLGLLLATNAVAEPTDHAPEQVNQQAFSQADEDGRADAVRRWRQRESPLSIVGLSLGRSYLLPLKSQGAAAEGCHLVYFRRLTNPELIKPEYGGAMGGEWSDCGADGVVSEHEFEDYISLTFGSIRFGTGFDVDVYRFIDKYGDIFRYSEYQSGGSRVALKSGSLTSVQNPYFSEDPDVAPPQGRDVDSLSPRGLRAGRNSFCLLAEEGRPLCYLLGPDTTSVAEERFESLETTSPGLACGLRADGTVRCWGPEAVGELAAPPGRYIEQCVGAFHWCGLTAEGQVRCLGEDMYGETEVPEGPVYGALACNLESTCVAEVGGGVACYGRFADGVLDPPEGLEAWKLAVNVRRACALLTDGGLRCWGDQPVSLSPEGVWTPPPPRPKPLYRPGFIEPDAGLP